MITKEQIKEIVERALSGSDIFLVHISVGKGNMIFVRIDKPGNITLEECQHVSKVIESTLDREKEDFDLEVSSPGIGEPLKVMQQYQKCIGRSVSVVDKEGKKYTGTLLSVHDEIIEIEAEEKKKSEQGKKKIIVKTKYSFNINQITAKEVLSF